MSDNRLAGFSVEELRSRLHRLERRRIELEYEQLTVLAELDSRGCEAIGLRGLSELIAVELRCSPRVAKQKAVEVTRFVGRTAISGEPLGPFYPAVADALSAGELGLTAAGVIADVIETLPPAVRYEHSADVEAALVEHARTLTPVVLRRLGQRIVCHLDPDGTAPTESRHERNRGLGLGQHHDATGWLTGHLSPTCLAIWQAVLTPLAHQSSTDESGTDTRTVAQRWHDAFEQAGKLLLEGRQLPSHAGLSAEVLVTVDLRDLEARIGQATTHHGGSLTISQAMRLAADAELIPVVLDQELGLVAHGRGRRLASPTQRKALFARDRGCTFPGCPQTAAQSEIHHAVEWLRGGGTDLDNLAIACGYHNNEAPKQGWQTEFVGGIPHWRPPAWLDPKRDPRRNWVHHPELVVRRATQTTTATSGGGRPG